MIDSGDGGGVFQGPQRQGPQALRIDGEGFASCGLGAFCDF